MPIELQKGVGGDRHHHVELEERTGGAREGDGGVVADHLGGHHGERLGDDRVDLPGHDRGPRLDLGQGDLGDPRPRAAGQQPDVGGDLVEGDGRGAQGTVGGHHAVQGGLGLEVVVGLGEGELAGRGQPGDHSPGELGVGVHPGAHGGPPQGQLAELAESLPAAPLGPLDLAGPAQELLTEPDRGGVLKVGAPRLDHRPELLGLGAQGRVEGGERREEVPRQGDRARDVDRGGDDVVRRLAEVDVVVGVDGRPRTQHAAEQLDRPVADHLVGVHVGRGAATGLEDVDHELAVELSVGHLLGSLRDRLAESALEQAELHVDDRGLALDQAQRPHEVAREVQPADREVEPRPHGAGAVVGVRGNLELPHRVALAAGGRGRCAGHQRRSLEGTMISNSAPFPGSERALALPPWRSATVLTM